VSFLPFEVLDKQPLTIHHITVAAQTAKDLTQDADIAGLLTDLIGQLVTAQGVAAAAVVAPSTEAAAAVVAAVAAAEGL
jgi:hypothetical protein